MITLWYLLSGITIACYTLLVAACRYGWQKLRMNGKSSSALPVSLVIPFRNEEKKLPVLLACLKRLNYPRECLEIIFVDDHSEDASGEIINNHIHSLPFTCKLIDLPLMREGKREALHEGVLASSFTHIITTDADCTMHPDWILSMSSGFTNNCRLLCGPVKIAPVTSLFFSLQQLELMPVMAVTAGLSGIGKPVMANGANMLFLKDDFLSYLENGYKQGSSGDDTWFLLYIKEKYPGSVSFSASVNSIISTIPALHLKELVQQRIRWTSKSRHYKDKDIITLGLMIASANALLFATFLLSAIFPGLFLPGLIFLGTKTLLDLFLLKPMLDFFGTKYLLLLVPLMEMLYPVYSVTLSLMLLRRNYSWKGRTLPS